MMTGITEITRNGAKASRGLISVQSRLNQITDEGSSTGKKLTAWYKEHNIAIYDQEGQLRNLFEIAGEVAKIWDNLSKNEQMYYLNTQAGANQTQNLAALISNYDQVLYAHELALDSVGSAEQENARYMESLEAKISNFKAAFQELALTFINSDFVKQIIDLGTALLKFANTDLGQTIIKIAAFSTALKGLSMVAGKLGLIETFTKLGKAIKSAFVFTTVEQNFSNIYGVFGKANKSANTLYGTTTKVTKGFGALAKNAKVAIGAMSGLGKVGLAIGALYGVAKLFMYIAEKPARDLKKHQAQLDETKSKMSDVVDEAEALEKKQEQLAKSGKELAQSEKERLNYLRSQTKELKAQSLTEARQIVKDAYKNLGTVKDPYAKGTVQYKSEEDAAQALINKYRVLQREYQNNKISQAEFIDGADQLITRLSPLYDGLQQVIDNGGTLTGVDKALYEGIQDVASAFVNAGGKCSFYNSALATVSSNNETAKLIVDRFTDSLVEEGGTYKFVSAEARAEAQNVLNLEAEKTRATLQQVNARIAMRLAEYSSFAGLASKESGLRGRRQADGSYSYATQEEKEAASLAKTYYKLKDAAASVKKMGVSSGSIKTGNLGGGGSSGSGSGGSGSRSKKEKEENEKVKKQLEKLDDKYLESYQRRERLASSYYNKVQKKAWRAYKADQIKYSTYQEYMKNVAKNIFEEIDYRYDNGIYSADTYYKKITYFANKFYKKNQKFNKITYEEYREYIKKATEETINALEEQYDKGKISGQKYYDKVVALAKDAKDKKILSTKEYKEYVEKAYEKLFDSITNQYERGKISAKKYYDEILIKGKKALKAGAISADEYADKLKDAAEAMKDMAQTKLDAFEFFAEDKKRALDKLIESEQSRIDQLNKELEAMDEQNDALDKQAERIKLVNALADAKKQKIRIFDERYGWVYVENKKAVQEAQDALDEFDKEQKREEARKKIEKEIADIEAVIDGYEKQKDAYDDLIDEQTRALERWEIQNKLGMTIEQAVLQGRLDNFENFKNNYIAAINEMITALKRLENAQKIAESPTITPTEAGYELGSKISDIASGIAGALSKAKENAKARDRWNASIDKKIAEKRAEGKTVYVTVDDDNRKHYSTVSKDKAKDLAGGASKVTTVKPTTKKKTKGKASGSHSLPSSALYHINELGDELLIPPTGNLAYLTKGTGIVPAHLTDNLMDLGKYNMSQWAKLIGGAMGGNTTDSHDIIIQNMTVKSDNANDFVRQLQNLSILKK
nr:MAG TPA: minor tail protein [Caudoviricetes sp.]